MTHEDKFISELKMFYDNDETIINSVSEKRIRMLLSDYKEASIPPPVVVFKDVFVDKLGNEVGDFKQKKTATENDLFTEAIDICLKHNIPMTTLRREKDKTRKFKNVTARMDFVKTVRSKYYSPLKEMGKFLNVDHTTVIHYLQTHI